MLYDKRIVQRLTAPGPACSSTHVPGYINHPKLKDAGQVFVVSVNDPFVYVWIDLILGFCSL